MFSSSVRRAALTAPPIPNVSSLSCTAPRVAASQALSYKSHQRRFSSSKPSSPADGSKGVADNVPAAAAQARPAEKKSRSSKKKSKEDIVAAGVTGRHDSSQNLPRVPSTGHISPNHISASDFFSLYRPISLTNSFPKAVTEDAFASIFTIRTKANTRPADVISQLSSTLEQLNVYTTEARKSKAGTATQQDQWNEETDELRAAITAESYRKAEVQHLDGTGEESIMNFPQHILSGEYRPFQPPPAPLPMNTAESLASGAEAAESLEPQHRTYTAVLTIEETVDANGQKTYMAHSSAPVLEEPTQPTKFLERMQIRQESYREKRSEENEMIAISVKRQRKLKMKKHKYKKLMRRTRNLRRRLDRN